MMADAIDVISPFITGLPIRQEYLPVGIVRFVFHAPSLLVRFDIATCLRPLPSMFMPRGF
jgi:hypothetical protein